MFRKNFLINLKSRLTTILWIFFWILFCYLTCVAKELGIYFSFLWIFWMWKWNFRSLWAAEVIFWQFYIEFLIRTCWNVDQKAVKLTARNLKLKSSGRYLVKLILACCCPLDCSVVNISGLSQNRINFDNLMLNSWQKKSIFHHHHPLSKYSIHFIPLCVNASPHKN